VLLLSQPPWCGTLYCCVVLLRLARPDTPLSLVNCCRGFQLLDANFGTAATFRNAITKSLVGQVTLFPTYTSLFLMYASLLVDGSTWEQGVSRVKQRFPGLLVTGSAYWCVSVGHSHSQTNTLLQCMESPRVGRSQGSAGSLTVADALVHILLNCYGSG
jgi:hypothetical protein